MTQIVTDRNRQLMLFAVMAMAFFLDGLDGTIVTIALPEIGRSFGMTPGESSWIVTSYFMMMAGLILVFGKIADNGAIKKVLVIGFLTFGFSSMACGFSQSVTFLIIARAVQGIGSAMLAATGIMLCVKFMPIEKRNLSMSLTVLGSSIGSAFGPVLGGLITQYLSWHWIFFINVPIGVLCAVFAMKAVPRDEPYRGTYFDRHGAIVLFILLVCALYSIESAPSYTPSVNTIVSLAIFTAAAVQLARHGLKCSSPIVDLRLFRIAKFDMAAVAFVIMNACFMGMLYLIPFMLSIEMGMDTVQSGMLMLIHATVTLLLCIPAGKLADKKGTRLLAALGCLFLGTASVMFAFTNSGLGIAMVVADLLVFGVVWGIGGAAMGPRLVEAAPEEKAGSASSLLSFFVYFGSALGTAFYSALFNMGSASPGCSITDLSAQVFMNGFVFAMSVGAVLSFIAAALSWANRIEHR